MSVTAVSLPLDLITSKGLYELCSIWLYGHSRGGGGGRAVKPYQTGLLSEDAL